MKPHRSTIRLICGTLSVAGLVAVFVLQKDFLLNAIPVEGRYWNFVANRTLRFLLNDLFAIGLIYALFSERKYVIFALYVQLAGVLFLLIPYFVLKYHLQSYNGPMINFLHRLIMNPTLLLLLLVGFYYHRARRAGSST